MDAPSTPGTKGSPLIEELERQLSALDIDSLIDIARTRPKRDQLPFLVELTARGYSVQMVAMILGRTESSVRNAKHRSMSAINRAKARRNPPAPQS